MSILTFERKRDFRRDRDTDQQYNFFKKKLDLNYKETFFLAYKYALFQGSSTKKNLQPNPIHIGQISLIDEKEFELMLIAAFVNGFGDDVQDRGDEILAEAEAYANAGVRLLYNLFMDESKSEILILEDIKNDIKNVLSTLK